MKQSPVVIIGTGVSGLMAAHLLADHLPVILVTKGEVKQSNSSLAQGGMAAAVGAHDHPHDHAQDTLQAGYHHNHLQNVYKLTEAAPHIATQLRALDVPFEQSQGNYVLGHEGAHGKRRILHAYKDQTGKAIIDCLWHHVQGRVQILSHEMVTSIEVEKNAVIGVVTTKRAITSRCVILASGGAGQLYTRTSNVSFATGDGLMLAYRAGVVLKDLEFVQFHPTLLKSEQGALVSEAVRGEGAYLVNRYGQRLLANYPNGELESRDVVARVLFDAIKDGEEVFLDARHLPQFHERFPYIAKCCIAAGIDPTKAYIPVEPGAHFLCGGVETDDNGLSAVGGLYAVGEVACTGVHGANRLASNSLLEGLVFAERAANNILQHDQYKICERMGLNHTAPPLSHALPTRTLLQQHMTEFVGIKRTRQGLLYMREWLQSFINTSAAPRVDAQTWWEDVHLFELACLMTEAALQRTESRGNHIRTDFPEAVPEWRTVDVCFQHTKEPFLKVNKDEQVECDEHICT
ncbi:L-aspartate oxidase [Bacillus sp. FSL W7-1360]